MLRVLQAVTCMDRGGLETMLKYSSRKTMSSQSIGRSTRADKYLYVQLLTFVLSYAILNIHKAMLIADFKRRNF